VTKPSTTALATPAAPAADVVVAAVLIRKADPPYPDAARAAQLEGDVLLEYTVGVDGHVREVRILRPVHSLLDAAARKAVLEYLYSPQLRNGVPEPQRLRIEIKFRIS
jgi:protein TonB